MKTHSDELLAFVALADCGSISLAASQLGLTPSAVSRTLARLEHKLGTTLLNRTTRRMSLSQEGMLFVEQARAIIGQMSALEERIAQRQQRVSGRLRINAAPSFMLHAIVPHIGEFRRLYPDIELQLNTDVRNIDLLAQHTDLAIRIGPLQDSTLHARPLGSSKLHLLASPAYLQRHGTPTSVESLQRHSLLGFTQLSSLNQWPLHDQAGAEPVIEPQLWASCGETLRYLALADQGIVCLSNFMIQADIRAGRLLAILPELTLDRRQPIHAVYYRNSGLALRIQCFLDFIQARLDGAY